MGRESLGDHVKGYKHVKNLWKRPYFKSWKRYVSKLIMKWEELEAFVAMQDLELELELHGVLS